MDKSAHIARKHVANETQRKPLDPDTMVLSTLTNTSAKMPTQTPVKVWGDLHHTKDKQLDPSAAAVSMSGVDLPPSMASKNQGKNKHLDPTAAALSMSGIDLTWEGQNRTKQALNKHLDPSAAPLSMKGVDLSSVGQKRALSKKPDVPKNKKEFKKVSEESNKESKNESKKDSKPKNIARRSCLYPKLKRIRKSTRKGFGTSSRRRNQTKRQKVSNFPYQFYSRYLLSRDKERAWVSIPMAAL